MKGELVKWRSGASSKAASEAETTGGTAAECVKRVEHELAQVHQGAGRSSAVAAATEDEAWMASPAADSSVNVDQL